MEPCHLSAGGNWLVAQPGIAHAARGETAGPFQPQPCENWETWFNQGQNNLWQGCCPEATDIRASREPTAPGLCLQHGFPRSPSFEKGLLYG